MRSSTKENQRMDKREKREENACVLCVFSDLIIEKPLSPDPRAEPTPHASTSADQFKLRNCRLGWWCMP